MERDKADAKVHERLAVLVVHGVGEQGCYEHLEAIAANIKQALTLDERAVHAELHYADNTPRLSPEHGWRDSPVTLRWCRPDGRLMELMFREAHWADLDIPNTYWNWIRLVGWSLSSPGVRLFKSSKAGTPESRQMRAPSPTTLRKRLRIRLELFLVSLSFLLLLATIGVADQILRRLSWRLPLLTRILRLIYDYLGDVKLYQDWFLRKDERLEVIGQKSRVAIRRRMNRALIQTAAEVERGELDGFYVIAHSLGTVVAFNGIMESGLSLPHHLSEEEWLHLPSGLKGSVRRALPEWLASGRPPWLDGGESWHDKEVRDRDLIVRSQLLAGMRGFLTLGSPLDKFAALWPEIVLINEEEPDHRVQWINVADVQDIVGGKINFIRPAESSGSVGGLELKKENNFRWSDQLHPGTAHTSYWKSKKTKQSKPRLVNGVIDWLEGGEFTPPLSARPNWVSWIIFAFISITAFVVLLFALASMLWGATTLLGGMAGIDVAGMLVHLTGLSHDGNTLSILRIIALGLLVVGAMTVSLCSVIRWIWEWRKFG